MNPHPIPQNVTSFQFRLIGDMTLKQFLYLASGSGIAYLIFVLFAARHPYAAWPLIIISALLGAAFAFMPIGSRPLDHWLKAFLKSIYSPTKRVWKKNGQTYKDNPLFNSRLVMYLSSFQPTTPEQPRTTQNTTVSDTQKVRNPDLPATPVPSASSPAKLPTTADLGKTVDLARQAQNLQIRIIQTERALSQIKTEAQQPTPIPVDYSGQVNKVMADLQSLVSQASQTREQLDQLTKAAEKEKLMPKEKIKVTIPPKTQQTQVALTTFPNVLNGIVKANTGDYLEAVVAVIYDKEGLPVRALRTNKLGQFSGSTPLPNGTYTLELEKDGYAFDVLQIELGGEVLPPLMITAKENS